MDLHLTDRRMKTTRGGHADSLQENDTISGNTPIPNDLCICFTVNSVQLQNRSGPHLFNFKSIAKHMGKVRLGSLKSISIIQKRETDPLSIEIMRQKITLAMGRS